METGKVAKGLSEEQIQELRNKKKAELKEEEIAALTHAMSIRDRLERKLKTDEVKLELEDDLGKFTLRFRKLTPLEHDEMVRIQAGMKDPAKTRELTERLYQVLGSASLDGLDEEYWKSGAGYSPDILVAVVLKVMAASAFPDEKYLGEILKFRPV